MASQKIVVLGTGGTIAGRAASQGDNVGYTAAQVTVDNLLDSVSGLRALASGGLVAEQIAQLDSKDMNWSVWIALARRCHALQQDPAVRGLVVTHGTDTLEETAWFLANAVRGSKPVVLTCAMRPSTSLTPDGPQNLLDAVSLAQDDSATGVLVVAAGEIHSARQVRKAHPYRVAAFTSDEAGPLGWMEEGRARWAHACPVAMNGAMDICSALIAGADPEMPWVEIVNSHACASARQIQALVHAGVHGLVVACTGNGTIHRSMEEALLEAQGRGVRVVRASRCTEGQIISHGGEGLPVAVGLSPVKARVSLMLQLLAAV